METINAEEVGKRAVVYGEKPLTDEKLLKEIRRLKRSVASFGGAMLLSAYRAEASRRKLKEV
jgi:uncharacterized protein YcbK (DUF882 family)